MPKKSLVVVGYSSAGSQGKRLSICRTIKHVCFVILEGARSINVQHHFFQICCAAEGLIQQKVCHPRNQRHLQNKQIEREREENAETPSTLSFVSQLVFRMHVSSGYLIFSAVCLCVAASPVVPEVHAVCSPKTFSYLFHVNFS